MLDLRELEEIAGQTTPMLSIYNLHCTKYLIGKVSEYITYKLLHSWGRENIISCITHLLEEI